MKIYINLICIFLISSCATQETINKEVYEIFEIVNKVTVPANTLPVGEVDEPPKFIKRGNPKYPEEMRVKGESGEVDLLVTIDEGGQVQKIQTKYATNNIFEKSAIAALNNSLFSPCKKDSIPVRCYFRMPVSFHIN